MSRKRYTPEQIIGKLRKAEVPLEQEKTRLRRAVADFTLDKLILQGSVRGNF